MERKLKLINIWDTTNPLEIITVPVGMQVAVNSEEALTVSFES
jgi:hypothetical protein